jgi:hypothetical protein
MSGFTLAPAASIAAGLSIGAAVTVGVTLAVEDHDVARGLRVRTPSAPHLVEYGDRTRGFACRRYRSCRRYRRYRGCRRYHSCLKSDSWSHHQPRRSAERRERKRSGVIGVISWDLPVT